VSANNLCAEGFTACFCAAVFGPATSTTANKMVFGSSEQPITKFPFLNLRILTAWWDNELVCLPQNHASISKFNKRKYKVCY
jgi:hypothetical protein